MILQPPPIVTEHEGVAVVRDDRYPGGSKARFLPLLFEGCGELVYASPAEGGAQTAIAQVAAQLGKRATIFVAKRQQPHDRTLMAKRLGARVYQVTPGYLTTVQARAAAYVERRKRQPGGIGLLRFGLEAPGMRDVLAAAARSTGLEPREVWCAAGSGFLASALAQAWPQARIVRVRVGRALPVDERFVTLLAPQAFGVAYKGAVPFPSDPHYDAKAWWLLMAARQGTGRAGLGSGDGVVFWNVTGPAEPQGLSKAKQGVQ